MCIYFYYYYIVLLACQVYATGGAQTNQLRTNFIYIHKKSMLFVAASRVRVCVCLCVFVRVNDRTVKGEEKRGGLVLVRFCVFVGLYSNHRDNENRNRA